MTPGQIWDHLKVSVSEDTQEWRDNYLSNLSSIESHASPDGYMYWFSAIGPDKSSLSRTHEVGLTSKNKKLALDDYNQAKQQMEDNLSKVTKKEGQLKDAHPPTGSTSSGKDVAKESWQSKMLKEVKVVEIAEAGAVEQVLRLLTSKSWALMKTPRNMLMQL